MDKPSLADQFVEWARPRVQRGFQPISDAIDADSRAMQQSARDFDAERRAARQQNLDEFHAVMDDFRRRLHSARELWFPRPALPRVRMGINGEMPPPRQEPYPPRTPSVGVRG